MEDIKESPKPDFTKMSSAAYHFAKYGKHRILTPKQVRNRKANKVAGKSRRLNRDK